MRIVVFANNSVGLGVTEWLRRNGETIVGIVVHPEHQQKRRHEIIEASGLPADCIFDGATLSDPAVVASLKQLRPDTGISAFFGHLLRAPILSLFPRGVVNLHPAYLPFNRGHSPNVWSIIDGTPAGVSLHFIDAGVDTGPIIAQRTVQVEPYDTGEVLYRRLERECLALFEDSWPMIAHGDVQPSTQEGEGTVHRGRDLVEIDRIDLDRHYTARQLIDILRARTFAPYNGAYFEADGKRIYMRLELWPEEKNES